MHGLKQTDRTFGPFLLAGLIPEERDVQAKRKRKVREDLRSVDATIVMSKDVSLRFFWVISFQFIEKFLNGL
jgi:hypothetical protein